MFLRKLLSALAAIIVTGALTAAAAYTINGGNSVVMLGSFCTATASSNAGTCSAQRGIYTTASLSTAHSAAATAQVITNSLVTSSSLVLCSINAYSGTFGTNGNPTVACVPGSGTITATIVNAADTNALSGTVGIGFLVQN